MTLHVTAVAVDEVTLIGLQAGQSSSFARPWRVYPVHELQARTRAVEETGNSMPIKHGGTLTKNVAIWSLQSCFFTSTLPCSAIPWT